MSNLGSEGVILSESAHTITRLAYLRLTKEMLLKYHHDAVVSGLDQLVKAVAGNNKA